MMATIVVSLMLPFLPAQPAGAWSQEAQEAARPVFRAGVDLVSLSAVVRDRRGRMVRDLTREDFTVFSGGEARPIVDFQASDNGPVSLAVLMDESGSMRVSSNLQASRGVVEHLLSWLQPQKDEAALFTFDRQLYELQPFTRDPSAMRRALDELEPLGLTSLYDAVEETARRLAEREPKRRAILVLTDGVDTNSRLTPEEVSGVASSIDVPVYIVVVASRIDHPGVPGSVVDPATSPISTSLANLARWTGGTLHVVSAPAHASVAIRELVSELRYQYLIAFEPEALGGWQRIDLRVRRSDLTVRTRGGYFTTG